MPEFFVQSISFAILMIFNNQEFYIPAKNVYLSMTHGIIVASGLILFSIGSKQLLSGELTMLIFNRSCRWNILGMASNTWN
jgi:hypothetical protein